MGTIVALMVMVTIGIYYCIYTMSKARRVKRYSYPVHLFGVDGYGEICLIIALDRYYKDYELQNEWAVFVVCGGGEPKLNLKSGRLSDFKAILPHKPTSEEVRQILGPTEEVNKKKHGLLKESKISPEAFRDIKNGITTLAELSDNWDGKAALPIENSAIKRSIRFLHLMNNRGELSDLNVPDVNGTPEGGVALKWWWEASFFDVIIPPENSMEIYYQEGMIDDSGSATYDLWEWNRGYSNNPNEVIDALTESNAFYT